MDHFISRPSEPLLVDARSRLLAEANALVPLGRSPDGLPLLLDVRRILTVQREVLRTLRAPVEELPAYVLARLAELESAVVQFSTSRGLEGRHYRTAGSVSDLLGPTLLARLLGAVSPMIMAEDRPRVGSTSAGSFENSALMSLAVMTQAEADPASTSPPTLPSPGRDARLRLSLDADAGGELVFADSRTRPLVFESALSLPGARAELIAPGGQVEFVPLNDRARYVERLPQASYLRLVVPRIDIIRALVSLARDIDERWHLRELVHGDLKPGNTFVLADGVMAFDGADVRAGHLCAITTPGWSAPEQVLAQPVTPASDVYPLALMLSASVQGAIYGEERSFIVPESGAGRRRLRLMADPQVFLDATHVPLTAKARVELAGFIGRCLSFEPGRRPSSAGSFADELAELLEAHVFPGQLTVASMTGRIHADVRLGKSGSSPAWIINDHYA